MYECVGVGVGVGVDEYMCLHAINVFGVLHGRPTNQPTTRNQPTNPERIHGQIPAKQFVFCTFYHSQSHFE